MVVNLWLIKAQFGGIFGDYTFDILLNQIYIFMVVVRAYNLNIALVFCINFQLNVVALQGDNFGNYCEKTCLFYSRVWIQGSWWCEKIYLVINELLYRNGAILSMNLIVQLTFCQEILSSLSGFVKINLSFQKVSFYVCCSLDNKFQVDYQQLIFYIFRCGLCSISGLINNTQILGYYVIQLGKQRAKLVKSFCNNILQQIDIVFIFQTFQVRNSVLIEYGNRTFDCLLLQKIVFRIVLVGQGNEEGARDGEY
eukprot:TRINITY_DN12492_c0_g1_i3.p1 TRINITY_DN12492_c0_g1~~TRINITY_DN12492_c0_g1_i3.p1  ORF type:complete len:253 (+),score=4.80 TRINITY_DN12492_c0_g1_i3:239-997(+)